jgi:cathepsin X
MGYFRILMGHNSLGIEMEVAWATPGSFTINNFPCYENGENCVDTHTYTDPSQNIEGVKRRLASHKKDYGNIRG